MEPINGPAEQPLAAGRVEAEAGEATKKAVFTLVNVSHAANHIQSGLIHALAPEFAREFGIAYFGISTLSFVNQMVAGVLQGTFGFFARFTGRGVLLGVGNLVIGMSGIGMGFSQGYSHLMVWTGIRSAGASAQHPVGAATLISYFGKKRAQILGLHQSIGNVGGWLTPLLVIALLTVVGWRQIFWILAGLSVFMGLAYFFFKDLMRPAQLEAGGGRRGRAKASLADYRGALRNRNIRLLSAAMLMGAAGRGTGVLTAFLTLYLAKTYGISTQWANFYFSIMMAGGVAGPVLLGWLADKTSRKLLTQASLLGSALFTYTIVFYPDLKPLLASPVFWSLLGVHVFFAGGFIWGRGPLLETLFTQATDKATLDTLISIYYAVAFVSGPVWTLVTGRVLDTYGPPTAFALMGSLYLAGMLLLAFVRFGPGGEQAEAGAS